MLEMTTGFSDIDEQNNYLVPFFIEESYCPEELFTSMIRYSKSYGDVQDLLNKMEEQNSEEFVLLIFIFASVGPIWFRELFMVCALNNY